MIPSRRAPSPPDTPGLHWPVDAPRPASAALAAPTSPALSGALLAAGAPAEAVEVVAPAGWPRRAWLVHNAALVLTAHAIAHATALVPGGRSRPAARQRNPLARAAESPSAARVDPAAMEALVHRAVEAAQAAGATYADAQITRTVQHHYVFEQDPNALVSDSELLGLGVRALVNGYWGFSASPIWTPDEAARLGQEAVAQAKVNARGKPRTVDVGHVPAVTGRWATPITIDPFNVSIEEKADTLTYWLDCANQLGLGIDTIFSYLHCTRQEQAVATSAGTLLSQTFYESGAAVLVGGIKLRVPGLDVCGKGWELFVEAKVPEQFPRLAERIKEYLQIPVKPAAVGRYTLVCDGVTMGRMLEQTLGLATQLDRALGYEANAGGTSYLDDPLGMLGTLQVAAPTVTITANRSAPAQLATVKWDAEGVVPEETTLVKNGVLVDYQTTREQAAWLAPYYQKAGKPVRSHGHAGAEDALAIPMQHMPNLALEPGPAAVGLADLIANVQDGILVMDQISERKIFDFRTDQQARNGYFTSSMRQIKNGRLGAWLVGGAVLFNTPDFWKNIKAVGGPATAGVYSASASSSPRDTFWAKWLKLAQCKGQPLQLTSHSVQGVAATIPNQPLIILDRKA